MKRRADRLVVDRREPADEAGRIAPRRGQRLASLWRRIGTVKKRAVGSAAVVGRAHLQRPQIGDQRLQIVAAKAASAGIVDAGLDALRIA